MVNGKIGGGMEMRNNCFIFAIKKFRIYADFGVSQTPNLNQVE